ncbi:MAG: cell division protein FtsA [Epsilonproteobacteria bacterium]|nr:cell division protein FtsA [Campylobacterota bacterium]
MSTTILGIDIGSTKICAIIAEHSEKGIKILGSGIAKSKGLKKGVITNIEHASKSIKNALNDAKRVAGIPYEKVIVSVSGAFTKGVDSYGVINVPGGEIGIKEINRAIQMADHNANISNDYEKLHLLPFNFKVDEQEYIEDPLGMSGNRLEVQAHIIAVQKSALGNLKKAIKAAGLEADNMVLNGYASSIAVLKDDEKELGAAVIDMGGATCNLVIHSGNSIRYNDFLGVGSNNVTNDLSMALHTPLQAAEEIKIHFKELKESGKEVIELPSIGDESHKNEVSLEIIHNVIYARIEETLMILAKSIEESGFKDSIGSIVLTGGFTEFDSLREMAENIFDDKPVRLAKPNETEGFFEDLKAPSFSTAIGLILYGAGKFTPYEIDSNNKLRYKDEKIEPSKNIENIIKTEEEEKETDLKKDLIITPQESYNDQIIAPEEYEESYGFKERIKRFWNMLTQLF